MSEPLTEPVEPDAPEEPEAPEEPVAPADEPDEEEAEEAADEPDAPADEPDEPVSHGATPEEWEARFKKSDQRFGTYERAVYGIFEDDAHDLIPCPLCLGAVRGFVDKNAAGRVPPEQADLVKHFLGLARPIEYPHSSQHRTCPECDGTGRVTTGSKVPGQENIGCGACNERGWLGPAVAPSNGHTELPEGVTGPTVFGVETSQEDVDEWNEPRILPDGRQNPNFGKMPHRKILVEPWGITAGLTAQDAVSA